MIVMLLSTLIVAVAAHLLGRALWKWHWLGLVFSIAVVLGVSFGLSSATYFAGLLLLGGAGDWLEIIDAALFLMTGSVFIMLGYKYSVSLAPASSIPSVTSRRLPVFLGITVVVLLVLAAGNFLLMSQLIPHGGWDAYAIWNQRARFLCRCDESITAAFDRSLAHPDYPLLLPAGISRIWKYLGTESLLTPQFIAAGFTFGAIAVVVSALSCLRGLVQGLTAGAILLSTKYLLYYGHIQYADMPLAFYNTSTFALLALHDRLEYRNGSFLVLAGMTAGCAIWTKNEGMLFVMCLMVARCAVNFVAVNGNRFRKTLREMVAMAIGMSPFLVALIVFKIAHGGSNGLLADQSFEKIVSHVSDGSRYTLILSHFSTLALRIPTLLVILLITHLVLLGFNTKWLKVGATPILSLILMSSGYCCVYVITPYNLSWHLATSMDRLFLHMFPALTFSMMLIMRTPDEAVASPWFQAFLPGETRQGKASTDMIEKLGLEGPHQPTGSRIHTSLTSD